jgi:2-pyrone-4,6-dicarboxylate lactonase
MPPACAAPASTSSSAWPTSRRDEVLLEIANRIAPLGWHVVMYFEAQDLPELYDFFTALPTTVVVDHMGRPDVSKPVDGPEFELFVKMMREHSNIWSKVSCPERLSVSGPKALNGEQHAYQDVVPFAKHLVEDLSGPRVVGHRLAAPQPEGPHAR